MSNPNAIYETVKAYKCPYSAQNLSHTWKGTIPIGALVPVGCYEILPGDLARVNSEVFARLMPTIAPILHEVDIYIHHFEVPYRLLWDAYYKFLFMQKNETSETIPLPPSIAANLLTHNGVLENYFKENTLADYLGITPTATDAVITAATDRRINILPFLAYQLIYNEYYRSQDLDPEVDLDWIKETSGLITSDTAGYTADKLKALFTLRYRGWEKDYFTSALPTAQLNSPARLQFENLQGSFDVVLDSSALQGSVYQRLVNETEAIPGGYALGSNANTGREGDFTAGSVSISDNTGSVVPASNVWLDPHGTLKTVIPEGESTSYLDVETLRAMIAKQEYQELMMRQGHRPSEVYRAIYNVTPDDLTIGRPRYLGGGKQNVVMSEVLSHTENDDVNLGTMGGHGLSYGSDNSFKHYFKEFGLCMSLLSVRPRAAYGQGVEKMFTKFERDDYANPMFAKLGEQPVKKGELFFSWSDGKNNETFGYQPIYTDYRSKPSTIHGNLRSDLKFWHMNRLWSNRPELNADFIHINPSDFDRNFPVESEYSQGVQMIAEVSNHAKFIRPIPADGTPKLVI